MGLLDKVGGFFGSVPIVGDLVSAGFGHASAKNLQNDSQAHDSHMFGLQAEHNKAMFGLESDFASAQAAKQYERQRSLLKDSPGLQMQGLRSAGLNPILAATGGFKTPAGGSLPIPTARASSSAKGSGGGSPPGAKLTLGQFNLLKEQATATAKQGNLYDAQADKVRKETEYVGNKIDISEPIARAMDAIVNAVDRALDRLEQKNDKTVEGLMKNFIERNDAAKKDLIRLWEWMKKQYGNAQNAFEEVRKNKGVINLPNIEVE
jgi:hypothetical protein